MPKIEPQRVTQLRREIMSWYKKNGRHALPFRKTTDPYRILVSEIMLQQTQVDRVIPFYTAWIHKWPSFNTLARANNREVLHAWSGLGYNRRALNLLKTARIVVNDYNGKLPHLEKQLEALPGIGPYTARAVLIFAYNKNVATIDTNIRRVLIHELKLPSRISQKQLWTVAEQLVPIGKSRDWHNALMDYAALALPKTPRIKPLATQSAFKGSQREIRGYIVKMLTTRNSITIAQINKCINSNRVDIQKAVAALEKEGILEKHNRQIKLKES